MGTPYKAGDPRRVAINAEQKAVKYAANTARKEEFYDAYRMKKNVHYAAKRAKRPRTSTRTRSARRGTSPSARTSATPRASKGNCECRDDFGIPLPPGAEVVAPTPAKGGRG